MRKQLFILMLIMTLSFGSALTITQAPGFTGTNTAADTVGRGIQIKPEINLNLSGITTFSSSTATRVRIFNSSGYLLNSSTISSNNATVDAQLLQDNFYYVIVDDNGGSYTATWDVNNSFPFEQEYLSFVSSSHNESGGLNNQTAVYRSLELLTIEIPGNNVRLDSPANNTGSSVRGVALNSTLIPDTTFNNTNATYTVWYPNATVFNQSTIPITGNESTAASLFFEELPFGTVLWNVLGCFTNSTGVECNSASSNNTLIINQFNVTGETYNESTWDTDNQTFIINVTINSNATLFSASLNYSGNQTPADTITETASGNYSIIRTIDIPRVDSNTTVSFNWIITLESDNTFFIENTDITNQSINKTEINNATASPINLNVTIRDEETLEIINSDVSASFNWWLGSGSQKSNNSFEEARKGTFNYSIFPTERLFFSNINFFAQNGSDSSLSNSYSSRNFDFLEYNLDSSQSNLTLLLLNSGNGTNFIINLKDSGLTPLEGYLVKIYRYYPSSDSYRLVESRLTDPFGQITANVVENLVRYRLEFYNSENVLVKQQNNVLFTCKSSIACSQEFIIEDDIDPFQQFRNITNYDHSFSFNNVTNVFTFVWNDNTGDSVTHRLQVVKYEFNGTTTVYNDTSNATVGALTYNVGSNKATYVAQAYRLVGGEEVRIAQIEVEVGSLTGVFGLEGLIWSMVLLMTLVSIGSYYPPIGIGLFVFGYIGLGMLGIIQMNPLIFTAIALIGGIFIWNFRG